MFSIRDRAEYASHRKMPSHIYSPTSLTQLEPFIRVQFELFEKQLDRFAVNPSEEKGPDIGSLAGTEFNILNWFYYPCVYQSNRGS